MTVGHEPPAWVLALDPSPDLAFSSTAEEGGWEVEARWWLHNPEEEQLSVAPREVVIRAAPDCSPDAARRGITSGVMRRMERLVGQLVAEMHSRPETTDVDRKYRTVLAERVRALPDGGPRGAPDAYYAALLVLYEEIELISSEPINDLADAMGVPKGTVKTRLRVARERLRKGEG